MHTRAGSRSGRLGGILLAFSLALGLAACRLSASPLSPTVAPTQPRETQPIATEPTTPVDQRPPEAILIQSPGPGSRLTAPIQLQGLADPTFEQTLGVRLLADDGSELASLTTTIQADVGQPGPFQVEIPFSVSQPRQAFIQVFTTSPRDGGVTHLASVGVQLAPDGPADIRTTESHPEQIVIRQPQAGDTVRAGGLHVAGLGVAGFEGTLVVDLYDADGNKLAEVPVIVAAPDMGQPGPFEADLNYHVTQSGPGRVVVRDVSPAFGGDTHLASVEVTLTP